MISTVGAKIIKNSRDGKKIDFIWDLATKYGGEYFNDLEKNTYKKKHHFFLDQKTSFYSHIYTVKNKTKNIMVLTALSSHVFVPRLLQKIESEDMKI